MEMITVIIVIEKLSKLFYNGSGIREVPNYEVENCKLKTKHNMKNRISNLPRARHFFYALLAIVLLSCSRTSDEGTFLWNGADMNKMKRPVIIIAVSKESKEQVGTIIFKDATGKYYYSSSGSVLG